MNPSTLAVRQRTPAMLAPWLVLLLSLAGTAAVAWLAHQHAAASDRDRFDQAVQTERQVLDTALLQRQRLVEDFRAFCTVHVPLRAPALEEFSRLSGWRQGFPEILEIGCGSVPVNQRGRNFTVASLPVVGWRATRDPHAAADSGAPFPGGPDTTNLLRFTREGRSITLTGERFNFGSNAAPAYLTVMAFFTTLALNDDDDWPAMHRGWLYVVLDAEALTRAMPGGGGSKLVQAKLISSSTRASDFTPRTRSVTEVEAMRFGAATGETDSAPAASTELARTPTASAGPCSRFYGYRFLGRDWVASFGASPEFFATSQARVPWFVAAVGALLSLLLAAITWTQTSHRVRVEALNAGLEARVAERTAALAETNTQLQLAIEQEKAYASLKARFVSMVSHEFRTPLGNIQSSANLLLKYFGRLPLERREELLQNIAEGTQRMAGMMEGVLLLSRVETATYDSQPEPVRLADLCRRITDEVESATDQRCPLALSLGPLPETVRVDPTLLRHLLTNLLSNAVKYSAPGMTVEIEAECQEITARFTIRDHGIGIPKEDQARLFEAFHRGTNVGETPGTGLGLLIVKRCVDLLGGDIQIESEVGRGTTVEVSLPVTRSEEEARLINPQETGQGLAKANEPSAPVYSI